MLNEKQIDRINRLLEKETFNFNDDFFGYESTNSDVDFKIQILGYRPMISVGTEYSYIRIKLIFTEFKDAITQFIFGKLSKYGIKELTKSFNENLYFFRQKINKQIIDILKFFDPENAEHIVIDEIEIKHNFDDEVITEQKKSRQSTRQVVKDITNLIKSGEVGVFYLPEDSYYSFDNFPVEFSVEVEITKSKHTKSFGINANFIPDEDVIEILITYNPDTLSKNLYGIIGELNEIITHELEHALQSNRGDFDDEEIEEPEDSLSYYLQSHEIPAQVKGFRRLSNLRKLPFESVVKDWFDTHTDIHKLSDDEQEEVINVLLDYNKKKH
jgi:hypothetical protein